MFKHKRQLKRGIEIFDRMDVSLQTRRQVVAKFLRHIQIALREIGRIERERKIRIPPAKKTQDRQQPEQAGDQRAARGAAQFAQSLRQRDGFLPAEQHDEQRDHGEVPRPDHEVDVVSERAEKEQRGDVQHRRADNCGPSRFRKPNSDAYENFQKRSQPHTGVQAGDNCGGQSPTRCRLNEPVGNCRKKCGIQFLDARPHIKERKRDTARRQRGLFWQQIQQEHDPIQIQPGLSAVLVAAVEV